MEVTDGMYRRMQTAFVGLESYDPNFVPADVLLSANESPYSLPQTVQERVQTALSKLALNRYPDPLANCLRDELALWWGLKRQEIMVGNGGDELLFNLLLAFGGSGRSLVITPPAFSEYALQAQLTGTQVCEVPRKSDFSLDEEALLEVCADVDLVILTSPNNPTGDLVRLEFIEQLAQTSSALIIVDEAYGEFAGDETSARALLQRYDNIVILRTLSKAFALAGARCGYILAPPEIVEALTVVRQPYSVNVLTQAVAYEVVKAREEFAASIQTLLQERTYVHTQLQAWSRLIDLEVWESSANFLFVRMPHAHTVFERLRDEASILVRDFSSTPMCENCLRITIGSPDENKRLLRALADLLGVSCR